MTQQGMPIGTAIDELARNDPRAPAVTCGSVTLTRDGLRRASNRLARAYQGLGVRHGDMVTIGLPNGIESVVATVAVWKLGATPQPVAARLPLPERQAIVELAASRLVVGADLRDHPGRTCVPAGFDPGDVDDSSLDERVSPSWKAPTSGGSTGRPKLIVATQPGIVDTKLADFFGLVPGGCQLVCGPLHHNGPFLFTMLGLFVGVHAVVLERFDADAALAAIDEHHVDFTMVVPTMLNRMLKVWDAQPDRYHLRSLARLWHMAAPCPPWLKEVWIERLGPSRVFELYGGTEGQAMTVITGEEWLEHPGSVGRATVGEITVLRPDGVVVAPGEVGEVYMRRASGRQTYRYVGAEARRRGSWESIGDMGWLDEEGYLFLADRRTDMILCGGANVYPAEVEGAILEHPAVLSCAVVGVPDDDLGRVPHAVVQVGAAVSVEELRTHVESRLARYKVPRSWEVTSEVVRDDAGKVRRSALSERASRRLPAIDGGGRGGGGHHG